MIQNQNVKYFLFGSKSDFNNICHQIISSLQLEYSHIKKIAYTCKNESCLFESEKKMWIELFYKKQIKTNLLYFDEEFEHKTKFSAQKASYIERNKAMIDNSDYCIIYYNPLYLPYSNNNKSGTKIAYDYIIQKRKSFINIADK